MRRKGYAVENSKGFAAGMVYGAVQQDLRQSAEDPQIQMAEDTAAMLANGQKPQLMASQKVDLAKSLAPYLFLMKKGSR